MAADVPSFGAIDGQGNEALINPNDNYATVQGEQKDLKDEVTNLDFTAMIATPFKAVIDASAAAAIETVRFMKDVCFDGKADIGEDMGKPVTVEFSYPIMNPYGQTSTQTLKVPLMCMIPIPHLRVQEASLEFNVKINSTRTSSLVTGSEKNVGSNVAGGIEADETYTGEGQGQQLVNKWKTGMNPVNRAYGSAISMDSTISNKKSNDRGLTINKEFSMTVKVMAVQDELPSGIAKLIGVMEKQISAQQQLTSTQNAVLGAAKA